MRSVLNELIRRHAIFAADLASAVRSSHQFATNVNAFCASTPVTPDASSLPAVKAVARAQLAQIDARILSLRDATISGDAGLESRFTLTSTSGVTLTDTQYIVLTKAVAHARSHSAPTTYGHTSGFFTRSAAASASLERGAIVPRPDAGYPCDCLDAVEDLDPRSRRLRLRRRSPGYFAGAGWPIR